MTKQKWNGQKFSNQLDQKRTNRKLFARFRDHCLNSKLPKYWVNTEKKNPEFSGLFFVVHDDSPGEFDIAEFFSIRPQQRFSLS